MNTFTKQRRIRQRKEKDLEICSAFHLLWPRYRGTQILTAPTASSIWETYTFVLDVLFSFTFLFLVCMRACVCVCEKARVSDDGYGLLPWPLVCVCVFVRACVCGRERERERENE